MRQATLCNPSRDGHYTLCVNETDREMNHKRKRPKQVRAGCLLCKPNKLGKGMEKKLGHRGFGKLRKEAAAERDMIDAR